MAKGVIVFESLLCLKTERSCAANEMGILMVPSFSLCSIVLTSTTDFR